MANIFIDRPILAWVIAIIVMICGIFALRFMPVNQYPDIAPPTITIQVTYPGASAQTVQDAVVQVIEQQMNGLDNLLYMSSESNADGSMSIMLAFEQGTDADTAQVQVQNKLSLAQPMLPIEVQQQGIRVTKAMANYVVSLGFISRDGSMSRQDIADYVATTIQDPISRTKGVGDFQLFGSPYAMRIWLKPSSLFNYGLTASDVSRAIREQNIEISSGQLGGLPAPKGQVLSTTIQGPTRLQTPEEFGNILLKTSTTGSSVRLKDVARIEMGAQNYSISSWYNGEVSVGLAVQLAPNANALETAKAINLTIEQLRPSFPAGFDVVTTNDTTPFISIAINNVIKTLIEAIALVFLIIFIFLQNWRATLIPTLAVPVVLLGTFSILSVLGFTINTITMFAMVLAIGLLVDDAIVVVENVERLIEEEKLTPTQATRKSMKQISGALFGVTMVLSSVFIPMTFFGGSTGVIYRQFSVSLVVSMILSILVAIIFTPALCVTLLQKSNSKKKSIIFLTFNKTFNKLAEKYLKIVFKCIRKTRPMIALYIITILSVIFLFMKIPSSFVPQEDQGILYLQLQTPPGASAERTQELLLKASDYIMKNEQNTVSSSFIIAGINASGRGQNVGQIFIRLLPWEKRKRDDMSAKSIAMRLNAALPNELSDASVFVAMPPPIRELGNLEGINFQLINRNGLNHDDFLKIRNEFMMLAKESDILANPRVNTIDDATQYELILDKEKAKALGISLSEINETISLAWGSGYINDFIDRGRVKRVYVQGESESRMNPDALNSWFVKNDSGKMVPFSAFSSARWSYGAQKLTRYNGMPSYNIQSMPTDGFSSGDAMAEMERIAEQLPASVGYEWSGLSLEEKQSGSQASTLYLVSFIVVILCLAGLYESWSIPMIVIISVPVGIIGTVMLVLLRGMNNDIYFQVGLLTTVGLSAKNAILIVEFAKAMFDSGMSDIKAIAMASRQRLRPIIMTSLAFMLGVLPLYLSSSAGASSQQAIGTAVMGGMFAGTFLVIFFVPVFFVIIIRLFKIKRTMKK